MFSCCISRCVPSVRRHLRISFGVFQGRLLGILRSGGFFTSMQSLHVIVALVSGKPSGIPGSWLSLQMRANVFRLA